MFCAIAGKRHEKVHRVMYALTEETCLKAAVYRHHILSKFYIYLISELQCLLLVLLGHHG